MGVHRLLERLKGIAQSGLTYTKEPYERERYEELHQVALELTEALTHWSREEVESIWFKEAGYATPKTDIRGVVFRGRDVLLCKEKADGRWSVPGGWADLGRSGAENVVKEVREESGYEVKVTRLLAAYDRDKHPHPKSLHHIYKYFYLCEIIGGEARTSIETTDVGFFSLDALPELSTPRVTKEELFRCYELAQTPSLPADFD